MDFRIFVEPQQGTNYDRLCSLACHADSLGFNGFFTSDHYLKMGDSDRKHGTTDARTTLAGLTRETTAIRLRTVSYTHLTLPTNREV